MCTHDESIHHLLIHMSMFVLTHVHRSGRDSPRVDFYELFCAENRLHVCSVLNDVSFPICGGTEMKNLDCFKAAFVFRSSR